MLLDHTAMGGPQPMTWLRKKGLGQTTDILPAVTIDPTSTGADTSATSSLSDIMAGLNAEALYAINLVRAQQGKAPLSPSQYAPSVNVGVSPATQNTVLIVAAIALVALFMMKRR